VQTQPSLNTRESTQRETLQTILS